MLVATERHLRLRDLGQPRRQSCSSRATGSASSRSTTRSTTMSSTSRPRSRRCCRRSRPPACDHEAVADYLTFLWVPDPTPCLTASASCLPGTARRSPTGGSTIEQYWDMRLRRRGRVREAEWVGDVRDARRGRSPTTDGLRRTARQLPQRRPRLERDRRRDGTSDVRRLTTYTDRLQPGGSRPRDRSRRPPIRPAGRRAAFGIEYNERILEPGRRRSAAEARLAPGRARSRIPPRSRPI